MSSSERPQSSAALGDSSQQASTLPMLPLPEPIDIREPSEPNSAQQVGTLFGQRYRLRQILGSGGMGMVYLAYDEALDQEVALKLFNPDIAKDVQIAMLRREVQLAQRVAHRNVCRTYDLTEYDARIVIKMEYIAGDTLAQRLIEHGRFSAEETVAVAQQILSGLEAAHAQGVIHCDLKPENIFLETGTGRVVLMDFGIARVQRHDSATGPIAGTPAYMSPEQALGNPLDGRSDLYSLGCVLFEMLTGNIPYPDDTIMRRAARAVQQRSLAVDQQLPHVPAWLRVFITRLLQPKPEGRFANATAALAALVPPQLQRRRWRGSLLIGAGLALAVAALFLLRRSMTPHAAWQPQIVERMPAYDEAAGPPTLSPDGQLLAYTSDHGGSVRVWVERTRGGARRALTPRHHIADQPHFDPTGEEILYRDTKTDRLYRIAAAGGTPELIDEHVSAFAVCASGKLVLALRDADTNTPRPRSRLLLRSLAIAERTDSPGASQTFAAPSPIQRITSLQCDPRSEQVVVAVESDMIVGTEDLWLVPLRHGGAPRRLEVSLSGRTWPIFAADGASVVYAARKGQGSAVNLWEMAITSGAGVQLTTGDGPDLPGAVTRDGRQLIFQTTPSATQIYAFDDANPTPRRLTRALDSYISFQLTPDGHTLVAQIVRGDRMPMVALPLGDSEELDESRLRILVEDSVGEFDLTKDGTVLVYSTARRNEPGTRILAVPVSGGTPRLVTQSPNLIDRLYVNPDRMVHYIERDGQQLVAKRVSLDGGAPQPERLGPWMSVRTEGYTAWRITARPSGRAEVEIGLYPPGVALDTPPVASVAGARFTWGRLSNGSTALVYSHGLEIRCYDFAARQDRKLTTMSTPIQDLALSPDGHTIYVGQSVARTRRYSIVNFAERPRPHRP